MAVWVVVGSGAYRDDGLDQVFSSRKLAVDCAEMLRFGRGRVFVEKREVV